MISGSAQLRLGSAVTESLAGRTCIMTMYPLSLAELKDAGITLDRDEQISCQCFTAGRDPLLMIIM